LPEGSLTEGGGELKNQLRKNNNGVLPQRERGGGGRGACFSLHAKEKKEEERGKVFAANDVQKARDNGKKRQKEGVISGSREKRPRLLFQGEDGFARGRQGAT